MARKLGKRTDQRMAMLKNQVSELLWYGEIETTLDRAKEVRRMAEKLITLAIRTYQDEVTVKKSVTGAKGDKVETEFVNDGAKKLAAPSTTRAQPSSARAAATPASSAPAQGAATRHKSASSSLCNR